MPRKQLNIGLTPAQYEAVRIAAEEGGATITADCRGPERPIAARRLSCSSVGAGPSRDISNASLSCATLCVPVNEIVKDFTFADPVRTYVIVLS